MTTDIPAPAPRSFRPRPPDRSAGRPLELIEREITELASHMAAAMCRWLALIAEFDVREGWGTWGCRSCADWVAWRCSVAPGVAREHVRVARRLTQLPAIRAAFARGELSYSKVRALTRVEAVEREEDLLELARHATASQLERLVRAYRGVVAVETAAAEHERPERWLRWDYADDGSLRLSGRLPAEEGALVVAALEAAREQMTADRAGAGAGTREVGVPDPEPHVVDTGEERADGLLLMAASLLAGAAGSRSGGDRHQVVVRVDADTLAAGRAGAAGCCELDAGVPLAAETARRLACDAAVVRLVERDGHALDVGRRTRTIPPALRRALEARDRGCRFPGCGARRFVDAHHVRHWAQGGATRLDNLVQLCRHHHRLVHEGGYTVRPDGEGAFAIHRPDGRRIPLCPARPRGHVDGMRRGAPARAVRPDACVPLSHDRLDLARGVDALLVFASGRLGADGQG